MNRKPFSSSNLIFVKDSLSDIEFLIDSRSTVSIIPLSYGDNEETATPRNLFALNQTEVKTCGKRNLTIDIGLSQKEMDGTLLSRTLPLLLSAQTSYPITSLLLMLALNV